MVPTFRTPKPLSLTTLVLAGMALMSPDRAGAQSGIWEEVSHHYVDNDGVSIHYVSAGEGPLVIFVHGFPDFWYTWRHQMEGLRDSFRVVAMDQRGYNRSDQPEGVDAYALSVQVSDVAAVIRDVGEESATIVGHDLGGMVAWHFAFSMPEMTDNLVVLNLPHPRGMARELAVNSVQRENSAYARTFQSGSPDDPGVFFGRPMNAQTLSGWVTDAQARPRYVEAFERSDRAGMLNFYKANYPALPPADAPVVLPDTPGLTMPVLVFHGLPDPYLNSNGLSNTWDWVDADLTLVTAPGAGHFVQHGAAELVTNTLRWWLAARTGM